MGQANGRDRRVLPERIIPSMDLAEIIGTYGPWVGLLVYALWQNRKEIWKLVDHKVSQVEQEQKQELFFDQQVRDRVLKDGERNWDLVNGILTLYNAEREERKSLSVEMIEIIRSTDRTVRQSVDVMQEVAGIVQLQNDRLNGMFDQQGKSLDRMNRTLEALWFILTKYGLKEPSTVTINCPPDQTSEPEQPPVTKSST